MRIYRVLFPCLLALILSGCATSHRVYRADHEKASKVRGVHYALPRAVVVMEVPIDKRIFTAGRFARFSDELLGVKARTKGSTTYSLKAPSVSQHSEPDPGEVFLIQVDGGAFETRELLVELSEQGILTHAKGETTSTALDFTLSTLETAAGLAGRLISPGTAQSQSVRGLDPDQKAETTAIARRLIQQLDARRRIFVPNEAWAQAVSALKSALGAAKLAGIEKAWGGFTLTTAKVLNPKAAEDVPGRLVPAGVLSQVHGLAATPRAANVKGQVGAALKGHSAILLEYKSGEEIAKLEQDLGSLGEEAPNFETVSIGSDTRVIPAGDVQKIYRFLELQLATQLVEEYRALQKTRASLFATEDGSARELGQIEAPTVEVAIREIDAAMTRIVQQFTGKTTVLTWTARFEWRPTKPAAGMVDADLFQISSSKGVLLSEGMLDGNPRLINPTTSGSGSFLVASLPATETRHKVRAKLLYEATSQAASSVPATRSNNAEGIYYRIPVEAEVRLSRVDSTPVPADAEQAAEAIPEQLLAEAVTLPQFGVVRALPRKSGSLKKSVVDVQLYASSGAIQQLTVSGTAPDDDVLSSLGTTFGTIQDARLTAEQAEANEEIDALTRRKQRLELERDLLNLATEIEAIENPVPASGAGGT